jgi:1-acyl-sn-glycerol-3-phosphate acyltransferase
MPDRTYRWVIRAFRILFRALGLQLDVRGSQQVPGSGPAVLACNHIGYLDFTFVGLAGTERGRLIRFMAKQSTFDNRLSGPLMRAMGHIPVDRNNGAAAYRRATRKLQRGELVGVFPEATISRAWILKPFKLGAATLAVREQVPLIPVVVWGGHRILTVAGHWSLRRHKSVMVLVGEPILAAANDDPAMVDAELRRRMRALLDTAQREYPDQPSSDADRWWLPEHLGGTAPSPASAALLDAAALAAADRKGRAILGAGA